MRQDNFTYVPQFKLMIAGNHAPSLRNVDEAMRRRLNILPFVVKPANPDRELEAKLRAEWPQILAWMIAGCLEWQANGLNKPDAVAGATERYFSDQDLFGQWIDEQCERGESKWEQPTPLFRSWCEYARDAGEHAGNVKDFKATLERRGIHRGKTGGLKVYRGVCLRSASHG
jgi:putative DNA primase/helicase